MRSGDGGAATRSYLRIRGLAGCAGWLVWITAFCPPALLGQPPPRTDLLPNGNVALLTDYGEQDFYVGALKGAVLKACPQARIVDLSHEVPPYDIELGAWQLWDSAREFPAGTVVVAIVDPGVGTGRRPVCLQTESGFWFIGPDNGLFTVVEREMGPGEFREIRNPEWMRPGRISTSFHGRDIFGPAAGHLACGERFEEAGPEVRDPVRLQLHAARLARGDSGARMISGRVLFADHYGNLQTDIPGALLDSLGIVHGGPVTVAIGGKRETIPFVLTYGDVAEGASLCFLASTGRLEIALNQASAADHFGVTRGAAVEVGSR
jgi:S-adenosyl-L-methionine hydrolase (adenosine-forming)